MMEDQFKNKLKSYSVDWDKEELLDSLKDELSKENKSVLWRWRLVFGLVICLLLILGLRKCHQMSSLVDTSSSINMDLTQDEKQSNQIKLKKEEKEIDKIYSGSKLSKNKGELILTQVTNRNSTIGAQESLAKPNLNSGSIGKSIITMLQGPTENETFRIQEINPSSVIESQVSKENSSEELTTEAGIPMQQPEIISILEVEKEEGNNATAKDNSVDNRIDTLVTNNSPLVDLDENENVFEKEEVESEEKVESEEVKLEVPKAEDSLPKRKFYVSLQSDIGVVYKNRNFISEDIAFVSQLRANEDTERSLSIINTQFNLGYQHSSQWSVQTGLNYSVINEVFNFNRVTNELVDKEKVRYFIVDLQDTTFVYDTISVVRSTTRSVRHFNKQRFFSIPLEFGYSFNWRRLNLNTRFGISYAFRHNFEGRTNQILQGNDSQIIYNDPELELKAKDRIGLNLGVGFEFPFSQNSALFTQATYRRSPKLTRDYSEQVYHSFSVGVGIKVGFN